uniref:Uncharacterized protein n=1 Tax=Steinernema glaseri TaxID=37863 RepID=A0A1I7Z7G7_9BILA
MPKVQRHLNLAVSITLARTWNVETPLRCNSRFIPRALNTLSFAPKRVNFIPLPDLEDPWTENNFYSFRFPPLTHTSNPHLVSLNDPSAAERDACLPHCSSDRVDFFKLLLLVSLRRRALGHVQGWWKASSTFESINQPARLGDSPEGLFVPRKVHSSFTLYASL